jgi:hypothetical protein
VRFFTLTATPTRHASLSTYIPQSIHTRWAHRQEARMESVLIGPLNAPLYVLSGLAVGVLVGMTGIGGGSLMTPLLVFAFGIDPKVAVGTDLLFAAITKSKGVWTHHGHHRSVEWRIVGLLALGSVPAALAVLYLLEHIRVERAFITLVVGIASALTGVAMLYYDRLKRKATQQPREEGAADRLGAWRVPLAIFTGLVIGVLVTLSSVGAGALGTIALLFLYPTLPALRIVGTDLAHAVPLTSVAGLGYWHMGSIDFKLLAVLLVGSLPGIYIGSHLGARVPETVLRPILASLLLGIGLKFVLA